ncbi:AI-2E family transporter [Fusibacter sp. 3D3]|uniref:AI-2E family transporter n=1 Tax=Fusibacter sp. 3D3 TaxID=1048380 RepID=UPI000856655F|nr:hypothetical protein [Fusibacter sp. 3D3]GAU78845.1 membrane protein, putative [Fusibacter sp. 3D3]
MGVKLITTASTVISALPTIYENKLEPYLISAFDGIEKAIVRLDPALVEVLNEGFNQFISSLGENITNIALTVVGSLSEIASSLPSFLIKMMLMIISTFFFAMDFDLLSTFMLRQFSQRGNKIIQTVKLYMMNTIFGSNALICSDHVHHICGAIYRSFYYRGKKCDTYE